MDLAGKLGGERLIDHAVAFEPRLAGEGRRHHFDGEMALPGSGRAGMPGMAMRSFTTSSAAGAKASVNFFLISRSTDMIARDNPPH